LRTFHRLHAAGDCKSVGRHLPLGMRAGRAVSPSAVFMWARKSAIAIDHVPEQAWHNARQEVARGYQLR